MVDGAQLPSDWRSPTARSNAVELVLLMSGRCILVADEEKADGEAPGCSRRRTPKRALRVHASVELPWKVRSLLSLGRSRRLPHICRETWRTLDRRCARAIRDRASCSREPLSLNHQALQFVDDGCRTAICRKFPSLPIRYERLFKDPKR